MSARVLALLLVLVGSWAPGLSLVAPARAASAPPASLDCEAMPCAEVMPAAARFRAVEGASHWEGLDESGDVVAYGGHSRRQFLKPSVGGDEALEFVGPVLDQNQFHRRGVGWCDPFDEEESLEVRGDAKKAQVMPPVDKPWRHRYC